jgi:predicted ATPase
MAMVAGPGGSGKSRLVGELLARIAATSVPGLISPVFASGKFDQYSRRPFAAVITAIAQLVDSVLMQDSVVVAEMKDKILNSDNGLGSNIGVAISMIPSIKMITGPQPNADAIGSVEVQHRFHRTLCQLLKVLRLLFIISCHMNLKRVCA